MVRQVHVLTYDSVFAVVLGLFLAMLVGLDAGFRIGRWRIQRDGDAHEGLGSIEAASLAFLGLLLGFAFSNALGRFDARRDLIVTEVNAIETAYRRLDLAPVEDQAGLRRLFRDYLD